MEKKDDDEPEYMSIYEDVATIIGKDKIEKFFNAFRGQQIEFPVRLYSRDYVKRQTIKFSRQKQGVSIKNLAHKFEYTERYLRKLIKDYNDNQDNK